jgi:hypothetical protein
MELTEDDIREFMTIWLEEFKEEITPVEARERASALLTLYTLLIYPWSEEGP